ncbi:MAG: ketopantoate reductase family protein [Ramlibacter sp.]
MRYVVYGAGAVGGFIAGRLHQQGHDVVLIARGANHAALSTHGLKLLAPGEERLLRVPVAAHPRELALTRDDIVILSMKTQDTLAAAEQLATCAPPDIAVFCAQNGVENERIAQRLFARVYGMYVFVFSASLAPGEVRCHTAPSSGVLDLGAWTAGADDLARHVSADLQGAGFDSEARGDIMDWKYGKLLANLGNALTASFGDSSAVPDLYEAAQAEGRACLRAAGIRFVPADAMLQRRKHLLPLQRVAGAPFPGSSAWQSLARGNPRTEIDYLSGEIVLLGRQHGVPTPLNAALQEQVRRMALAGTPPGSLDPDDLRRRFGMPVA